ncbi:lipopolysaccharide export system protein LptA [Isorropodon fossajaponicum endosymbiont JTNG4]|uniref:lipopolysaccharide transport periplasmic protein LptA n=1 Tax=Isorropodon fossajaponicum symbiont TaxID=883811 RepID=UPI001916275C|nr:lipopolysaccharide transport periplasmic protein LptA [Isorropodon fossajaponicum symbiont]BBB23680.1 lipopolysaccharide export system protein LptA [Isorropodon fossajaponicum endosymbiont JTNG4]
MSKVLLMCLLVLSGHTIALVIDSSKPIKVSASMVVIDEKKKISTYVGKASITQGFLMLRAEIIQLFSNQQEVIKIIAKGTHKQPAHYQQNQPNQSRFIEAQALNITYLTKQELVHLKGKAHLVQGFDSFSGGTLDYDIKNDKIITSMSKDGTQRARFKIKL